MSPFYSCYVQRAVTPRSDRVLALGKRHPDQESQRLGHAQRRQDFEPERVNITGGHSCGPLLYGCWTLPSTKQHKRVYKSAAKPLAGRWQAFPEITVMRTQVRNLSEKIYIVQSSAGQHCDKQIKPS